MPGNGGSNLPLFALHFTADNRVVDFVDFAPGKLRRKRHVRLVVLGHHHAATGLLVQPVDDPGPGHAANAAELAAAMVKQRVDQGVTLVAGSGMHDQSCRLVQHDQRIVLIQDVQRNILRMCLGRAGFGPIDPDLLARVVDQRVPLEMCITSNVHTHTVASLSDHPFRTYLNQGVVVTLNTDGRLVDGITLTDEYFTAHAVLGLTQEELAQVVLNTCESAFLPDFEKVALVSRVQSELEKVA